MTLIKNKYPPSFPLNSGWIHFLLNRSNSINNVRIISLVKVCTGVSGMQSPKQPQALIFPVNKTKLVKK
jgi:hypothetical protein